MESNTNSETNNSASRQIQYAIRFFAGKLGLSEPVYAFGTVKSVDEDNRTCSVEITLGEMPALMEDINLMASDGSDGFVRIPSIDSQVQIKMMPDKEVYVSMWSEIDAIEVYIDSSNKFRFDKDGYVWNDGLKGGMINIVDLTLKLNQLLMQLQLEMTAIAAGIAAAGGSYAPGILSTFVKTDYEDTKIKH